MARALTKVGKYLNQTNYAAPVSTSSMSMTAHKRNCKYLFHKHFSFLFRISFYIYIKFRIEFFFYREIVTQKFCSMYIFLLTMYVRGAHFFRFFSFVRAFFIYKTWSMWQPTHHTRKQFDIVFFCYMWYQKCVTIEL